MLDRIENTGSRAWVGEFGEGAEQVLGAGNERE